MSNSAERLVAILQRATSAELSNVTMMHCLRILFNLPEGIDDFTIMRNVGMVFTMPAIVAEHITRFPDLTPGLYLGWRPDLYRTFRSIQFEGAFADFRNRLSESLINNIRFCAKA